MELNINIETEIEELETELEELHKQGNDLGTLDKIHKLKERHEELISQRDEQLQNILSSGTMIMIDNSKLESKVQFHLDAISHAYHEIESGKYSVKYTMELEKEVDKHMKEISQLHEEDLADKQKSLNKLYSRYKSMVTTRVKDVTPTEAILIKEELNIMTDEELREYHANNRQHEVIRRLAAVEMKKRNVQELPDISPIANMVNKWSQGMNADLTRRSSKHGIMYFKESMTGVDFYGKSNSEIKNYIRNANKGANKPVSITLRDLLS